MNSEIEKYNESQSANDQIICRLLMEEINRGLSGATSKIWHGGPVWFIDGNPIAGYSRLKDCIQLLFWSGQTFEEAGLKPIGKYKAAEVRYTEADHIDINDLQRWLAESVEVQWDYKNIVRRKGELERLK